MLNYLPGVVAKTLGKHDYGDKLILIESSVYDNK